MSGLVALASAFAFSGSVLVAAASPGPEHLRPGVMVVDFDPFMDDGNPLTVSRGWNDPAGLQLDYMADVATASAGIVNQRVVRTVVVRDYPVKPNGFRFTNATYQTCFVDDRPKYCTGLIDYQAVLNTAYDSRSGSACDALRHGRVDEIWLWGGPWFGYLEWNLVAQGTLCPNVRKPFVVMGFSYERGDPEMLHDLGHRAEGLIQSGIGFGLWNRFDGQWPRYSQDFACPAQPDASHPEVDALSAHAGNVHFPPNAFCHYQYDRDYPLLSDADDWANYPNLTGRQTLINSSAWGGTQQGFLVWWMGRFPRHAGSTLGIEHDWWRYVFLATHRVKT